MSNTLTNRLFNLALILIILIGIILRIETYLLNRPLWHDEASLAVNIINRNLLEYFKPLDFMQKAPPLFMMSTKMISIFFGTKELSLRFIPLLCSIISIFLFYLVSKKILNTKLAIIVANLLFSINYYLIYYAQEFKQYSCDVMVVLLSILLFSDLNIYSLPKKTLFLYAILCTAMIFVSFPAFLVIASFIVLNLINLKKENYIKIFSFIMILGIIGFLYYYFLLSPTRNLEIKLFDNYWNDGFLKLNFHSIFAMLKMNFSYFFFPNKYYTPVLIAPTIGLYYLIKEKTNTNKFVLLTLLFTIIASFLGVYPLKERIALYIIPIAIIIMIKSIDIDFIKQKTIAIITLSTLFLSLYSYNIIYIGNFVNPDLFKIQESRETLKIIKERYQPSDILVINQASLSDYAYYKNYFKFSPRKVIKMSPIHYNKEAYFKILNNLPKNKNYWFYFPFDYYERPIIGFVKTWLKVHNIKYEEFAYKRTHLLYLSL